VSIVSLLFISQNPPPHHPFCFTIIHKHITKQILIILWSIILTQFASLIHQKKIYHHLTTFPPHLTRTPNQQPITIFISHLHKN